MTIVYTINILLFFFHLYDTSLKKMKTKCNFKIYIDVFLTQCEILFKMKKIITFLQLTTLLFIALILNHNDVFSQWTQKGADINAASPGAALGSSVASSADGNSVIVGIPLMSGASGRIAVYQWNGNAWTQQGANINGDASSNWFGTSVAISGDGSVIASGAPFNNGGGTQAGHVKVYEWDGTAWSQRGTAIDGTENFGEAGGAIALSNDGNSLIVGAKYGSGGGSFRGNAKVYTWDGMAWTQKGMTINGEADNDAYGTSVSISDNGNVVAIGAPDNDENGNASGHARVLEWDGNSWVQRGTDFDGDAANDFYGTAVHLSANGDVLAVGGPRNDGSISNAGQVRVFDWNGTAWAQRGTDLYGDAADDFFGTSVSLSSNGDRILVGATGESTNGLGAGQAKVYDWDGTNWIQIGNSVFGGTNNDQFGLDLELSSDGSTFIAGAPGNGTGYAQVYEFTNPEIDIDQAGTPITNGGNYDFGNVNINSSSPVVPFTINNTGNADLVLTGTPGSFVVLGGADASAFLVTQTFVASPIGPGISQTFEVTFDPTTTGTKTATLTITNNDSDEGTYVINLNGVGDLTSSLVTNSLENVSVHPNPTSSEVRVENLPTGTKKYTISDRTGAIVSSGQITELDFTVNLLGLSNGMYYLQLQTEQESIIKKVVKL